MLQKNRSSSMFMALIGLFQATAFLPGSAFAANSAQADAQKQAEYNANETASSGVSNEVRKVCAIPQGNLSAEEWDAEISAKYEKIKSQLYDMNDWHLKMYPGHGFTLYDSHGDKLSRDAQAGDYTEVTIPGDLTGRVYWDQLEEVSETDSPHPRAWITLRAAINPSESQNPPVVQHFFTNEAQNTYAIEKDGNTLVFTIHGTGEVANTDLAGGIINAAENFVVSELAWGIRYDGKALYGLQNLSYGHFAEEMLDCSNQ